MILRLNNNFNSKQIITDVGSSKIESSEIIKRNLKKNLKKTHQEIIVAAIMEYPKT